MILQSMRPLFLFCFFIAFFGGVSFAHYGDKIVGGVPAALGEFPSQVALHLQDFGFYGAGSVLSEKYILTAAHCVWGVTPDEVTVYSGSLFNNQGQFHRVINFTKHEEFNYFLVINDIAILEVDPPFTLGPYVQPLPLPNQGENPPVGAPAVAIGWGNLYFEGPVSETLNKVTIEIRDQGFCEEAYSQGVRPIIPGEICADDPEGGLGTCHGDSGGPIFVDGVAVGITSWAKECTVKGYPTVFTRISYYRDWITQQTGL